MNSLLQNLENQPVFALLDKDSRRNLAENAIHRELIKGEVLVIQGEVWPYIFLIERGRMDAVKVSVEGRNLLVTSFHSGELFWGLAFFQAGAPTPATLEAGAPTLIHLWPRQIIEPIFKAHGEVVWELCCLMILRLQRASSMVDELAFQPVSSRLARLLITNFASSGESAISRHLTLDEMAARIGTTREMVCRVLYRFADDKLIDVTRTEFVLTDKAGLTKVADGL